MTPKPDPAQSASAEAVDGTLGQLSADPDQVDTLIDPTAVESAGDAGSGEDPAVGPAGARRGRRRIRRRVGWVAAGMALMLAVGAGGFLLLRPTGHPADGDSSKKASGATATVARRTLAAQTQLNGTLGYAGAQAVTIPSGTDATTLHQAQDTVSSDRAILSGDQTSVDDTARSGRQSVNAAADTVRSARHTLTDAVMAKRKACRAGSSPACTQATQQVASDRDQLSQAEGSLASAKAQATAANNQATAKVSADQTALSAAKAALEQARRRATNAGATYTALDTVGTTVKRGQPLYAVDGVTVPLFYGHITPWRALYRGVSPGADVAALTRNLAALGYGSGPAESKHFTTATQQAVEAWQRDIGAEPTGVLALGDVVYRPGPVVVTAVTASKGQAVQPGGGVLTASSTSRTVSVSLDAAQQGQVRAGDKVTVTLPNGRTVPATVASVGSVASSSGSSGKATIGVTIRLARTRVATKAVAGLDKAPVLVAITTATVKNALVVPVNALLALAGGGYAVEVVEPSGSHRLVGVTLGTFDDALGVVEVTRTDLKPGQRVVVPSS